MGYNDRLRDSRDEPDPPLDMNDPLDRMAYQQLASATRQVVGSYESRKLTKDEAEHVARLAQNYELNPDQARLDGIIGVKIKQRIPEGDRATSGTMAKFLGAVMEDNAKEPSQAYSDAVTKAQRIIRLVLDGGGDDVWKNLTAIAAIIAEQDHSANELRDLRDLLTKCQARIEKLERQSGDE